MDAAAGVVGEAAAPGAVLRVVLVPAPPVLLLAVEVSLSGAGVRGVVGVDAGVVDGVLGGAEVCVGDGSGDQRVVQVRGRPLSPMIPPFEHLYESYRSS